MTEPTLYRNPTKSEIIKLAAFEGHDADIPTNAGSLRSVATHASVHRLHAHELKDTSIAMEKDIEKDGGTPSASSIDEPQEETETDPNIVDFDGPDDPENPLNWSTKKKWGMVTLVSAITFLTPLASSMFAPGVPEVMREFDSTNNMLEGFMVSVYVLGFAVGPLSMSRWPL